MFPCIEWVLNRFGFTILSGLINNNANIISGQCYSFIHSAAAKRSVLLNGSACLTDLSQGGHLFTSAWITQVCFSR